MTEEMQTRLVAANKRAFTLNNELRSEIFSRDVKQRVCKTGIILIALYACEKWTIGNTN